VPVIDTATDQVTAAIDVHSDPAGVAVSPDGTRAYVTTGASLGSLSVIDTGTCHGHHPRAR
jgi:DNA-binding beta-propeller fold protein YncE